MSAPATPPEVKGYAITDAREPWRPLDLIAAGKGTWVTRQIDGRVASEATVFLTLGDAAAARDIVSRHLGPMFCPSDLEITEVDPHNFPIEPDPDPEEET